MYNTCKNKYGRYILSPRDSQKFLWLLFCAHVCSLLTFCWAKEVIIKTSMCIVTKADSKNKNSCQYCLQTISNGLVVMPVIRSNNNAVFWISALIDPAILSIKCLKSDRCQRIVHLDKYKCSYKNRYSLLQQINLQGYFKDQPKVTKVHVITKKSVSEEDNSTAHSHIFSTCIQIEAVRTYFTCFKCLLKFHVIKLITLQKRHPLSCSICIRKAIEYYNIPIGMFRTVTLPRNQHI